MRHRFWVGLFVAVSIMTQAPVAFAQVIDNATVSLKDFYESYPGYDVDFVLDGEPDRYLSDYASRGGGVDTFIEFDFGKSYSFSKITMTDRVTSGGPNFQFVGGLFDLVTSYSYVLSKDADFTNGDGKADDVEFVVEVEPPAESPVPEDMLELLQSTATIPNVEARYVRWSILATNGQNPGANDFEFYGTPIGAGLVGDFNGDGTLDAADIDALTSDVRANANTKKFDVTGDNLVNQDDRTKWVNDLRKTYFGDSNLDGQFNSSDFVSVFGAGQYEDAVAGNSQWATGDWDGDGEFNSSDFVKAFQSGGYEMGPRAAVAAVPEVTFSMAWWALAGLPLVRRLRRAP